MKKIALTAVVLCCAGLLAMLLSGYFAGTEIEIKKETVYIALAGPMSGFAQEEGKAMLRGATLAYEEVKREGKLLKNKKIEIIPYDDKDSRTAVRIASDIVNEDKVLLVLGNYSSASAAAAGPVYQSNGIPAITASAAVESSTMGNEWFFRTIPGMRAMAEFAIQSIGQMPGIVIKKISTVYDVNSNNITQFAVQSTRQQLGVTPKTVFLIYDSNNYDTSIAEKFKQNTKETFEKVKVLPFDNRSDNKKTDIKKIIAEIRAEQSVGPIFFATTSKDSGDIISNFRYPGTDYPIIGMDSFSVPTFIRQFESYPNERKNPGYYTNDIYAVSPFISYLADQPNALAFREEFRRRYGKEPSWVAAAYHDAMLIALNAVEKAEIRGKSLQEDRRRIRNALNRLNEKDVAVNGVTGDLYFDEDGNVNLPLSLGFWLNHTFLPFYQQQPPDTSPEDQADENKEKYTAPLRVVYAGVDINAVRNIDLEQGSFTADFYLWFRFQGIFDDTAVTFINARNPVTLGKPLMEKTSDNITVRAYRVIADLKTDSKAAAYPLDRHTLRISFRHNNETRKELIYIPDVIGMNGSVGKKNRGETLLEKLFGWEISEIVSRQNLETIQDENKENISYSRIDTEISIHRHGRGMLLGKILLPFLYIMALSYFLFCISPERIWIRLFVQLALLFLTVEIRILYKYIFPGQEIVQYMFYLVVALLFFSALISGGIYWAHRYNHRRTEKCILYKGMFLYLAAAMTGIVFVLYSHFYFPWSSQIHSRVTQSENVAWLADTIREITNPLLR